MKSDQLIFTMVNDIISTVNRYQLPLSVKALALENVLLRVNEALKADAASSKAVSPEEANNEQA